jgi:tetrahydromethanopterin S-methyltransferase subunit G
MDRKRIRRVIEENKNSPEDAAKKIAQQLNRDSTISAAIVIGIVIVSWLVVKFIL